MALNPYMHPRNPYLHHPPDFELLARRHADFAEVYDQHKKSKSEMGANRELVRILTQVLLKEDFGLQVKLPKDRLVPTLPLRLNYLLWIQDLLQMDGVPHGLDVGTGASCVYPLLASKHCGFAMTGTETDFAAFQVALDNVKSNGMEKCITLVHTEAAKGVFELPGSHAKFDFTMCNPPFHFVKEEEDNSEEMDDYEEASSPKEAGKASETSTVGGEVTFVANMIRESKEKPDFSKIFTSMVGKKSSLKPLKSLLLEEMQAKDISTTELCQGRTMRWAIAWTFDENYKFPNIVTPMEKKRKEHKLHLPLNFELAKRASLQELVELLSKWLLEVNVSVKPGRISGSGATFTLKTFEQAWKNMRRKRREENRHQIKRPKLDEEMEVDKEEEGDKEVQLCARVILKTDEKNEKVVQGQMIFINGAVGKDGMQQLIQYIKNKDKGIY